MFTSQNAHVTGHVLETYGPIHAKKTLFIDNIKYMDVSGKGATLSSDNNIFIKSPELSLSNGASIEAKNNLYLFNVENLKGSESTIIVGGTAYLPKELSGSLENSIFDIHHSVLIDKDNIVCVCNAQNYQDTPSLEEYCNMSPYMKNSEDYTL